MKTQLSRNSFDANKRYSGIYQQMGRMLTDADWNELTEIGKNRLADVLTDVINKGSPRERGLVEIIEQADGSKNYNLRWGYAYVDGIVAQVRPDENATLSDPSGVALEYMFQADFPDPPALPASDYILYLDVWERTIITLEDDGLRDVGLHGADTCTRSQTMAQVKWCEIGVDPEDSAQNPSIGESLLSLEIRQGSTEPDPCDPCAEEIALQDKLGNYLFRVEVHHVEYDGGGQPQRVWLKWSSENGAEQYALDNFPEGFAADPWAYEFFDGYFDPDAALAEKFASEKHLGLHLATGFSPSRGELVSGYPDSEPSGFTAVRRWDGYCELAKTGTNWELVSGSDRGVDLSAASGSDAHGHVSEGSQVVINHDSLTISIDIADSAMLAGDYWYATVRQAINIAGDVILDNQLPTGILHHYMTIGSVISDEFEAYQGDQCKRFDFPSLTDIRAKDVCYDTSKCDDMPNVDTVQEAIDHLCRERDLRWHNKHLHGWGIVCGLVVNCGPNAFEDPDNEDEDPQRREITVTKGYAITCEGDDLVWTAEQQQPIDLIGRIQALAEQGNELLENGSGSICLRLDQGPSGQPVIALETFDAATHSNDSLLEGTLLMDFVQHCVLDLIEAITQEFSFLDQDELDEEEGGSTGLVSEERQKSISFLNLIIQLLNQQNGAFVYLSRKEHRVLKSVYHSLRELLQSKTFCAMFDGQEFPAYPQQLEGPSTFFGKNLHTRIKMHPSANSLYTYGGTDNTINVYDVASEKLVQVIEMPSAEGAEVSAITFSNDGSLMIAAASVRGIDSVFGIARINDKHSWEQMTILCDIEITEMQMSQKDPGLIYAVGLGKGLFFLRPEVLMEQNKPQPEPAYAFNAVGHLQIDQQLQLAYCTANSDKEQDPDEYDQVLMLRLEERADAQPTAVLNLNGQQGNGLTGDDGIALQQGGNGHLYVITNAESGSSSKQLLTFNTPINVESQPSGQLQIENTQVSLAFHASSQQLILGFEDGYRLQLMEENGQKTRVFRVPVQIQPLDIVVEQQQGNVYVLNYLSNTVSAIPAENLNVTDAYLQTLSTYRTDVLRAFYALFGGLLQYLKDCFCDHLLVKCPECDEDDVIYLATVEIRNNEIYNICNFDKRKYVKSFPTMGYWLSIVPIWPMLKAAVGKMCCSILPDLFNDRRDDVIKPVQSTGSVPATKNNRFKAKTARSGIQTYQRTDFKAEIRNQSKSTKFLGQIASDGARGFAASGRSKNAGVRKQALMDSDVNEAISELNSNNIQVAGVKKYDAKDSRQYLAEFVSTPQRIEPDSKVTLYQKDGKVAFYKVEKSQTFDAVNIDESVEQKLQQFETRKSKLANFTDLKAELAVAETRRSDLAELDQIKAEIGTLKSEKNAVHEELASLRSQVNSVKTERDTLAGDVSSLNANLELAAKKQKTLIEEFETSRPIKDLSSVDSTADTELKGAGIRTIGELATADATKLTGLKKINRTKLNALINEAKLRVKK